MALIVMFVDMHLQKLKINVSSACSIIAVEYISENRKLNSCVRLEQLDISC